MRELADSSALLADPQALGRRLRESGYVLLPDAFAHPARVVRVVWPHRNWPAGGEFFHQDWSVFHVPDMLTTWFPLGAAAHPGWDEIGARWASREHVAVPAGLSTFDHTAPDLPLDHPRPSRFLG
jgi:hypothetical protein